MEYYIFGAHSRAQTLAEYLKVVKPEIKLRAFLVDNEEENPREWNNIPVLHIGDTECELDINAVVYLGIRGVNQAGATERLRARGFAEIIPVTPEFDVKLRNAYMRIIFQNEGREFTKLEEHHSVKDSLGIDDAASGQGCIHQDLLATVYVAKSVVDRPLVKETPLKAFEKVIQVGRELADEDIPEAVFKDNSGNHISRRNRQFSELTGMYWLWKNVADDVIGLEHYRRRFLLPEGWQLAFAEGKADVILPVPLYVAPSLEDNYLFRHDRRPWDAMLRILKEGKNDMYEAALRFFRENGCFSPCNMLIVRKEVLDDLCSWMFPVLLQVVEEVGILDNAYQNRYGGFLSERMISFFFYYYADRYKIVYADKSFLG